MSVPLPDVDAVECVRVLVSLGWVPTFWTDRECTLERGHFRIVVPRERTLSGEALASLLEHGGVLPLLFVEALERLRTAGMHAYADAVSPRAKVNHR